MITKMRIWSDKDYNCITAGKKYVASDIVDCRPFNIGCKITLDDGYEADVCVNIDRFTLGSTWLDGNNWNYEITEV